MKEQKEANQYYCPPFLSPEVNALHTELAAACLPPFGEVKTEWISPTKITDSLRDFVDGMNRNGLDTTINTFSKSEGELSEKFILGTVSQRRMRHISRKGDGLFYFDGDHALTLGYLRRSRNQVRPLWFGVISFSSTVDMHEYSQELIEKKESISPAPIILQLQGPADWSYDSRVKYENAKKVLGKLRWEKALVTMVLKWAESTAIPVVYLLPSSLNEYRTTVPNPKLNLNQRLHMRYDVTAERMGFDLDQRNSLFRMLIYVPSDDQTCQPMI